MVYLMFLIFLGIFLYLGVRKILHRSFLKIKADYDALQEQYNRLSSENTKLERENSVLNKGAEETIALYDITREICKSIQMDKVWNNFFERINKYIT
ncbi:MAG: hypothetical protein NC928_00785, partial [Candidatus Omnitrophica bacterium]|nr:hypothetical protein [Candidatus Omnitrophota bacterium]